jgi:hypothetical protein
MRWFLQSHDTIRFGFDRILSRKTNLFETHCKVRAHLVDLTKSKQLLRRERRERNTAGKNFEANFRATDMATTRKYSHVGEYGSKGGTFSFHVEKQKQIRVLLKNKVICDDADAQRRQEAASWLTSLPHPRGHSGTGSTDTGTDAHRRPVCGRQSPCF